MLVQTRRVAGERHDRWYYALRLLLVCDTRCPEIASVMLPRHADCHADLRGLGGKCVCVAPCHWGAQNMLCKRSVSLVSLMIGGIV